MIGQFLDRLWRAGPASEIVLQSASTLMSRSALLSEVRVQAARLHASGIHTVALHADNGVEWIVSDLACQLAGIRIVPLPLFFSAAQLRHAISGSGADALITDAPAAVSDAGIACTLLTKEPWIGNASLYALEPCPNVMLPPNTQKITFTSGTTGAPKGVCLSGAQLFAVVSSLAALIELPRPRHLCILPLSTLLENLAGVYAPLQRGGTVIVPALDELGLLGSSGLDIGKLLKNVEAYQPNSLILVPEILERMVTAAENGWKPPASLQFVAVGGSKLAPTVLHRARRQGIPALERYGLSECASVVSLNLPGAQRTGSVGRPLPHLQVGLRSGEIVVSGNTFLGYANQPESWHPASVETGDLGHIDTEGFIHIDGRAKAQIITSFGRNVAPEWVESEIMAGPLLQQAFVFGDARPYCVALLQPREASTSDHCISVWINQVNRELPDYARVNRWCRLPQALNDNPDAWSSSGRPRREYVERACHSAIDNMYETENQVCNA